MRSGTTFFRNVLSANPNVQVLGSELNVFWTRVGRAPCGTVPCCPQRKSADATPETIDAVQRGFSKRYVARNFPYHLVYRIYRMIRYGNETFLKGGSPYYLLNKSTHLNNKIPFLDQIFPEAKYIFVLRDIFSHANSLYRHLYRLQKEGYDIFYPDRTDRGCWRFIPVRGRERRPDNTMEVGFPFSDVPRYWLEQNAIALKALQGLDTQRYRCIQYQDIVERLPLTLHRLEEFLGTELNQRIHTGLINNYTLDPLSAWESELNEDQLTIIKDTLSANQGLLKFIYSFFPAPPQSRFPHNVEP